MDLQLYEVLFVGSFIIPGLIFISIGLRTWNKDWLAIYTGTQMAPWFFLHVLLVYTVWAYDDVILQAGNGEIPPPPLISYRLLQTIVLATVLPMIAYAIYMIRIGEIVILRGRRDIVIKAICQILGNRRLGYSFSGDGFHVPSIDMRIQVNWTETSGVVGTRIRCKDRVWREAIQESIFNTFTGRPSERSYPLYLILGCIFLGSGIVSGVLIAMA